MVNAMTAKEQAAFAAGIETARQMALTAAVSIEVRADAGDLRQRAAVAALQGLAEGLRDLAVHRPEERSRETSQPVLSI